MQKHFMEQRGLLVRCLKRPRPIPITSFTRPQLRAEGGPLRVTSVKYVKSWQAGKVVLQQALSLGEVSRPVYNIHLAGFEQEFSPEHEGVCIRVYSRQAFP